MGLEVSEKYRVLEIRDKHFPDEIARYFKLKPIPDREGQTCNWICTLITSNHSAWTKIKDIMVGDVLTWGKCGLSGGYCRPSEAERQWKRMIK